MHRGKIRIPRNYAHTWKYAELRALFSIFYPYRIKMVGADQKVTLYGLSPFFQEVPKDLKDPKYPEYEVEFENIGGETTATLKCVWKPKGM